MINYKKPVFRIAVAAAAGIIAVAAVFLAMRKEPPAAPANAWLDLRELRENYTAEQAAADGCVVLDGSSLVYGEKYWIDYENATKSGQLATVRIYQSYSDQDGSYYVKELAFDGEKYTLTFYDRTGDTGEEFLSRAEYKYLIRSPYSPVNSDAGITDYYILADDGNVTGSRRFFALLGVIMVVHAAFATMLAMAPRWEGTLGQTKLSPIAKALYGKVKPPVAPRRQPQPSGERQACFRFAG